MQQAKESCLFLHIPKAAGTTLQTVLSHNFSPRQTWIIDPNCTASRIDHFLKLSPVEQQKVVTFRGHMAFGLHRHLNRDCTYVTLLRHPVDRMVSHYHYVKQCGPGHYLYRDLIRNRYSLADYVRSGISPELDNGQVRLLTDTENSVPIGSMTPRHLEQAKENLVRYFGVVGTVDRFDEFLIMLRRRFDLPCIDYDRENVTRNRPRLQDLPVSDREAILSWNRLDEELYAFAQELMTSQIQAYGPNFKRDLREFRRRQWRRRQSSKIALALRSTLSPLRRTLETGLRKVLNTFGAGSDGSSELTLSGLSTAGMSSGELPCHRSDN